MVNTSVNPVTAVRGGVETRLDTLAYNISTKGGIGGSMAALRGSSAIAPGRSGSIYRRGRKREEGRAILSMWAQDTDVDGAYGADSYSTWRANQDKLLMIFDTQNEQIELREYITPVPLGQSLAGKPYRRAMVEVRAAIDPEMVGRAFGEFKVECVINDVYWEDSALQSWISPVGTSAVGTHNMTAFNGMTAPIEDAVITVTGPATNPKLTDPRTGHWVQLSEAVASAAVWTLDCKTWASSVGGVSKTAKTTSSGPFSPRLFGVSPADGAPQVQFSATGAGTGTKVQVQARRKFH